MMTESHEIIWMRYGTGKWHRYREDYYGPTMLCGVTFPNWSSLYLTVRHDEPPISEQCARCRKALAGRE